MTPTAPRVALLTGAAHGIGRATALELAAAGYRLLLTDRDRNALDDVAGRLHARGTAFETTVGDLADLDFARSLVEQAVRCFGGLDLLVNNAAAVDRTSARDIEPEFWDTILRVNLTAPAFLARWAAQHMETAGRGVIINIASIEAFQPKCLAPAYIAAKAGLRGLTWNLASLFGPHGIRVVCVSPGAIDTALSRHYTSADGAESLAEAIRADSEDRIPLRRWGTPQEVAQAIVWLASDQASYLTGTEIVIDGGWTRHLGRYSLTDRMLREPPPGQPE